MLRRLGAALMLVLACLPITPAAAQDLDPACILYAVPGPAYLLGEDPHQLVYGCTFLPSQIAQASFPTAGDQLRLTPGREWAEPGSLAALTPEHFATFWLGWERYACVNALDGRGLLRTICLFRYTDPRPGELDRGEREPMPPLEWDRDVWETLQPIDYGDDLDRPGP